jgi:hypothetical protein
MQLSGRVKSISNFIYQEEVNDTTSPYQMKEVYSFDTSGNTIERISYNSDRFDSRNVYKYNKDHKNIAVLTYGEDSALILTAYKVFDSTGNLTEEGQRGNITHKTTYTFDEHNNVITSDRDGEITRFDNTYDNEGIVTERKMTFNDGKEGKEKLKYDSLGNTLEGAKYFMNGKLFYKVEFSYNHLHLPTTRKTTDKDNNVLIVKYAYDVHGNLIEHYENQRARVFSISYEYDGTGNWIKSIRRDAVGQVQEVAIRGIMYY